MDATGTLFSPYVKKSAVVVKSGVRIGIIGVTTPTTRYTSEGGASVDFSDPVACVRTEAARLHAEQGIDAIVVLSHLGYWDDQDLAALAPEVDLIIGGHTHTLLAGSSAGTALPAFNASSGEHDVAAGPYPTWVSANASLAPPGVHVASRVPVVQARWGARYMGRLDVTFGDHGVVTALDGAPLLLGGTGAAPGSVVNPDLEFDALLAPLRGPIAQYLEQVVGQAAVDLSQSGSRTTETALGDLACDASLWYFNNLIPDLRNLTVDNGPVSICLLNGGSLRASISQASACETQNP